MNSAQLLSHFDRISDAPDAIPRLRRFILDLAVRGKLVEQDLRDEPTTKLLKQIQTEKERLVKAGKIRKQEAAGPIDEDEVPFEIPPSWCWVRLIDVLTKLTDGTHHSPTNLADGDFKYITAKNIKSEGVSLADVSYVTAKVHHEIYARCNPEKGDILYIKDGATTGVVTINDLDEPFSMLSSVALLKLSANVYNRLIVEFLRSPFFYMQMRGFMKGAAITRVTLTRMAPALIPLPPLAEQQRIVAKVNELMALCDRLEAAQVERESRRDRLVGSSLNSLNNGVDPDAFRNHARFYFNHLPRLTTRSEHIQQLRQTILTLAVRGKLAPQDSNDEPSSELFNRIQAEKARIVKAGQIRKQQSLPPLLPDELPFQLLGQWQWLRLGEIGLTQTGTTPSSNNPEHFGDYIPFVKPAALTGNTIDYSGVGISKDGVEHSRLIPKHSALMVCIGSSIGKVNVTDRDVCCNQQINAVTPYLEHLTKFISFALKSDYFQKLVLANAGMGTLPIISKGKWEILPIPLPPLAEQQRIVAKVDELMAICDRLEAQLTTTQTESRRLLEAVLHEALAG